MCGDRHSDDLTVSGLLQQSFEAFNALLVAAGIRDDLVAVNVMNTTHQPGCPPISTCDV
ncbi:putative predicted protein [Rhizobium favelukesii]|uniref:Uncharacterized protein n=1 Tax=Rhizobium favelukesii TaxID=348824 RepID=W6R9R9_9HYPH|nr:putative predicted protein [Rhizobium favelukesii]